MKQIMSHFHRKLQFRTHINVWEGGFLVTNDDSSLAKCHKVTQSFLVTVKNPLPNLTVKLSLAILRWFRK